MHGAEGREPLHRAGRGGGGERDGYERSARRRRRRRERVARRVRESVPYARREGVHDPARVAGGAVGGAERRRVDPRGDPTADESAVESANGVVHPRAIPARDRLEQRVPRPRDGVFGAHGADPHHSRHRGRGVRGAWAADRGPRERRDDLAEGSAVLGERVGQLCRDARASVGDDEELRGRRGGRVGSEIPRVGPHVVVVVVVVVEEESPARIEVLAFGAVGRRDLRAVVAGVSRGGRALRRRPEPAPRPGPR